MPIVDALEQSLRSSFVDSTIEADDSYRSCLIANSKTTGENLLSAIRRQLASCSSFDFAVAFVASGGIACLVQALAELKHRGVKGRILTSTYLNFNEPEVFRKLLEYDNIEVRVYQGNLHAKGYIFNHENVNAVIIGSSNLTQTALTCNREWNVLFRSYTRGGMFESVSQEFENLWNDSLSAELTPVWIEEYERVRKQSSEDEARKAYVAHVSTALTETAAKSLKPNKMQKLALEALDVLHRRNEPRALLISATGTGKTYLSAFDVLSVRPKRVLFLAHRRRILEASKKSYAKLLGARYTYALYESARDLQNATCVFAMCSTISRHLDEFRPTDFDYIVVDEAHRTGSASYRKIMDYFVPKFYFGMTATPNRTDGFDVFSLFNNVIAYQITLQDALENDMLSPFHYYGIADLQIDYENQDDLELFAKLTSKERVRHVIEKIEEYSVDKANRCGLIFCNRNDEAKELSDLFNEYGYRTVALSGDNTDEERDSAISALESGRLQYIFSVDIFNEGIDIPSVNQIIMLRRTESPIVFVQQLGRGLRKNSNKEYTLVLDFIGNYQKNFLVPVALSGDTTYNKDRLRNLVKEGSAAIPGASTVSFDRISEARIYRSIDCGDFTAVRFLKEEYTTLRRMLGRIPSLDDFDRNCSIDPLLLFKKFGSYHEFLSRYEEEYRVHFSDSKCAVLKFVSQKLANGKRFEELFMLRELLDGIAESAGKLLERALTAYRVSSDLPEIQSATTVLYGDFISFKNFTPLVTHDKNGYRLTRQFETLLQDVEFRRQIVDLIDFGLSRYYASYGDRYKDTSFVLNAKYTYEEVCRLLGWERNVNGQNIGGYKYDAKTNTFPVFINYDKAPDINESIRYEDRFISRREFIGISKQGRSIQSPEIQKLKAMPGNGMKAYLFMRKNKDDGTSKEFYFLGEIYPTGEFQETVMPEAGKRVVEIAYRLDVPVRHDIYEFMMSDLSEEDSELR